MVEVLFYDEQECRWSHVASFLSKYLYKKQVPDILVLLTGTTQSFTAVKQCYFQNNMDKILRLCFQKRYFLSRRWTISANYVDPDKDRIWIIVYWLHSERSAPWYIHPPLFSPAGPLSIAALLFSEQCHAWARGPCQSLSVMLMFWLLSCAFSPVSCPPWRR